MRLHGRHLMTERKDCTTLPNLPLSRRQVTLLGASAVLLCASPVRAADTFGPPQDVTLEGYTGDAMEPFLTRDGKYLLFNNSNQPPTNTNLQWAERIDDLRFVYRGEIAG